MPGGHIAILSNVLQAAKHSTQDTNAGTVVVNRQYFIRGFAGRNVNLLELFCNTVTTAAGAQAYLGVYNIDPTSGKPTTLIGQTSLLSLASNSTTYSGLITGSPVIPAGDHWLSIQCSHAISMRHDVLNNAEGRGQASWVWYTHLYVTRGSFAALPSNVSADTFLPAQGNAPQVLLRFS